MPRNTKPDCSERQEDAKRGDYEELKEQKFGIEIEMTGITRAKAAEVTAEYFGTRVKYLGTYYDTYAAIDTEGRQWKFMSDGSIRAEKIE